MEDRKFKEKAIIEEEDLKAYIEKLRIISSGKRKSMKKCKF